MPETSYRAQAREKRAKLYGPPDLMTTGDVAYRLHINEMDALDMMQRGVIPSRIKGNGKRVVFRKEFERWLDKIEVIGCPELGIPPCGKSNYEGMRVA